MIISLIVAASENNAIGKNNQLLWSLPNDMKFFKNTTWGMPVIMGRKTFESLKKDLPGRFNIVMRLVPVMEQQAAGITIIFTFFVAFGYTALQNKSKIRVFMIMPVDFAVGVFRISKRKPVQPDGLIGIAVKLSRF